MNQKLRQIIREYWEKFQDLKSIPFVERNSIPILWFGDVSAYFTSNRKIVTIGLNPSFVEFEDKSVNESGVTLRFPKATGLINKTSLTDEDISLYMETMNEYFRYNPFRKWFSHHETVLNILNASYYDSAFDRAIHIDIYSPIATKPNWGELSPEVKSSIIDPNSNLCIELLEVLEPDIIIVAANAAAVGKLFKKKDGNKCSSKNADSAQSVPNTHNKYIRAYYLQKGILIWGINYKGDPFGSLSDETVHQFIGNICSEMGIASKA